MTLQFDYLQKLKCGDSAIETIYDDIDNVTMFIQNFVNTLNANNYKDNDYKNIVVDETIQLLFKLIYGTASNKAIKELDSQKECKKIDFNITYKINVIKNKLFEKMFVLFILLFQIEPYLSKTKYYIGIDYEFHKGKDVRLMQMNFERKPSNKDSGEYSTSYIWIIKPPDLESKNRQLLIEKILCHPKITKIMNGADALDTPYMINDLFVHNTEYIKGFFHKFIDLRYLCELYKAMFDNDDNKCDIYTAYHYFGIITTEKYKLLLESNETVLEPLRNFLWEKTPSDDIWDICKMEDAVLYYVVFDVIYLRYHLLNVYNMSAERNFLDSIKLAIVLSKYSLYEKHKITSTTETLKQIVDPINNYFYFKNGEIVKLNDTYKLFIENDNLEHYNTPIAVFFKITYFRSYILYLFKYVCYYMLVKKYTAFATRNNVYKPSHDLDYLYKLLNDTGFTKLILFVKYIEKAVSISKYC